MAWPKGKPRKQPKVEEPRPTEQEQAADLKDKVFQDIKHSGAPEDRLMYEMAYDEGVTSYEWESNNPIKVPADILKDNPGMRFRWRAVDPQTGGLRRGDEYQGWQVYKSSKHPSGKKFGGDLVLAAMPEERAEARNRKFQQESTDLIRSEQEKSVELGDRAALAAQSGDFAMSGQLLVGAGKVRDKRTGKVTEQYRGYHPEELREMQAKAQESRRRGKKYFT